MAERKELSAERLFKCIKRLESMESYRWDKEPMSMSMSMSMVKDETSQNENSIGYLCRAALHRISNYELMESRLFSLREKVNQNTKREATKQSEWESQYLVQQTQAVKIERRILAKFLSTKNKFYASYEKKISLSEKKSLKIEEIIFHRRKLLDKITFEEWDSKPEEKMTDDELMYVIYKITHDFGTISDGEELRERRMAFIKSVRCGYCKKLSHAHKRCASKWIRDRCTREQKLAEKRKNQFQDEDAPYKRPRKFKL